MLLWIAIAILTVAAAYVLLTPLFRADTDQQDEAEPAVAVFADQLAEIDREAERGLIAPDDAEVARREIARRLLRASQRETQLSRAPWRRKLAAALVVAIVPLIGFGAYSYWGAPEERDQPLAQRETQTPPPMSMEAMVAAVEERLAEAPDDGAGWGVIAPIYLNMGRYQDAADAYEKAIALDGPNAARFTGLGESLMLAQRGSISIRAEAAFEQALALEPEAIKPRVFLAIAARQRGETDEAVARWQLIVSGADGSEPWMPLAQRELAALGRADMVPAPAEAPQAPDAAATEAMIEGMVDRLSARLAESGGTAEEWVQLIRSELVLGRPQQASAALRQGLAALEGDAEAVATLRAGATALGVTAAGAGSGPRQGAAAAPAGGDESGEATQ